MARPAKWNSPTDSIRVPAHLIPRLLEIAKTLDQPIPETADDAEFQEYLSFVQNLRPQLVTIAKAGTETRYLIYPDLITFDEFSFIKRLEAKLFAEMAEQGIKHGQQIYAVSRLIEEFIEPMQEGKRG